MIINASHISMDASTGHKDVSRTAQGKILNRNHSGRRDPHFTLDLKDIFSSRSPSSDSPAEIFRARSSVTDNDGSTLFLDNSRILSRMVSTLTGREARIRHFTPDRYRELNRNHNSERLHSRRRFFRIGGNRFSMFFSSVKSHCEYEFYSYNCTGRIQTGDGRKIDFSLELSMQRTTMVQQTVMAGTSEGYLIDPLVLDFEGPFSNLAEQPFLFDLDGDGRSEMISGPGSGCGFLALDRNGNQLIDNGTELFGPLRGSGFADLAVHDDDNNRWIDDNDEIFDKLAIWMNPSGKEQMLQSLKDAGVGAISLDHAQSLFNLKTRDGSPAGQVNATGIFLTEKGEAKSLRDIRLNILDGENEQDKNGLVPLLRKTVELHRRALDDLLFSQEQRKKDDGSSNLERFLNRMLPKK